MKIIQAMVPPVRPKEDRYTSCLVFPVAKIATTKIINAKAAMEAPKMMKASCVGSTLKTEGKLTDLS